MLRTVTASAYGLRLGTTDAIEDENKKLSHHLLENGIFHHKVRQYRLP